VESLLEMDVLGNFIALCLVLVAVMSRVGSVHSLLEELIDIG